MANIGGTARSGIGCWLAAAMGRLCHSRAISFLRRIVRATKAANTLMDKLLSHSHSNTQFGILILHRRDNTTQPIIPDPPLLFFVRAVEALLFNLPLPIRKILLLDFSSSVGRLEIVYEGGFTRGMTMDNEKFLPYPLSPEKATHLNWQNIIKIQSIVVQELLGPKNAKIATKFL